MEHNTRPLSLLSNGNSAKYAAKPPADEAADSLGLLSCDKEITLRQPNTAVRPANTAVREWRNKQKHD